MRLLNTIKACLKLFKIRMFGTYKISRWDGEADYSVYQYKDKLYYIPIVRE